MVSLGTVELPCVPVYVCVCLLNCARSCDSASFLFGVPLKKLLWFTVDFPL